MSQFRNKHVAGPLALLLSLVVTAALALAAGSLAASNASPSAAAAEPTDVVAKTGNGTITSKIVGETVHGRTVSGTFTPLRFSTRDGRMYVRGFVDGVVHNASGTTRTFATVETFRVKRINGEPARARTAAAAAACQVLDLVLGPLDLNLLGLRVHLDRVVLKIDAVPGAGALLGNLVCAVAGLLDGGLAGVLGRVRDLLNRIIGILGLSL